MRSDLLLRTSMLMLLAAAITCCAGMQLEPPSLFAKRSERGKMPHQAEMLLAITKGKNYEKTQKYDKAREIYQQLIRDFPNEAMPYHRMGIVADKQGRHREAEAMFSQAIRLSPMEAEYFNDIGFCFYLQGELEKAESSLQKAVALDPTKSRYSNNLAMVLGHLGRYPEALEVFAMGGSDADAYYNLAFIYTSQNKIDLAKDCFRQCLLLEPGYKKAKEALESFVDYERTPSNLRDIEYDNDGIQYVPYEEAVREEAIAQRQFSEDVSQAQFLNDLPDNRTSRSASDAGRGIHERSRGLLNRNMRSQRDDFIDIQHDL